MYEEKDIDMTYIKNAIARLEDWLNDLPQDSTFRKVSNRVENSAFYRETVPEALMRPSEEHWMPELPANEE